MPTGVWIKDEDESAHEISELDAIEYCFNKMDGKKQKRLYNFAQYLLCGGANPESNRTANSIYSVMLIISAIAFIIAALK